MARVTVEDCITKVKNRFELVLLATQRARELSSGSLPTVPRDNDKNPVIALREIADETVQVPDLRERFLYSLQHQSYGFSSQETHDAELSQAMEDEETSHLLENATTPEVVFSKDDFEEDDFEVEEISEITSDL